MSDKIIPFQDAYSDRLKVINGIKFTQREIDTLAFILCGRSAKTTASLLAISPKTVETHTHNIMLKLGCSSRENIIDFIEKMGKASAFRAYYDCILVEANFRKRLKEISVLTHNKRARCILYGHQQEDKNPFMQNIEKHLSLVGINVVWDIREKDKPLISELLEEERFQSADHSLCIISETLIKKFQSEESESPRGKPRGITST